MNHLAARYCELHHLRPEAFADHLLRHALYRRALPLHWLLKCLPDYFAPDLELIAAVGRLEDAADFSAEVADFHYHPANLGRLRRDWRLRLSVTRLRAIVEATLHGSTGPIESRAPFALDEADDTAGPAETPGVLALVRHWRTSHHHPHA